MERNKLNGAEQDISIKIQGTKYNIVPTNSSADILIEPPDSELAGKCVGHLQLEGKCYLIISENINSGPNLADLLTSRELQIAHLVAKGMLNKQIANKLNLSCYTISTHLRRIYIKLGVHNRTSLASKLFELYSDR